MTKEEFIEIVNRKNRYKIIIETAIAITTTVVGLALIYFLITTDWLNSAMTGSILVNIVLYLSGFGIILLGIYGLRKMQTEYQIITLMTEFQAEQNDSLISTVAFNLKWSIVNENQVKEYVTDTGIWFGYGYEIRILTTHKAIHLDIQSLSVGLFDFGDKSKLTKRIKDEIGRCLHVDSAPRI